MIRHRIWGTIRIRPYATSPSPPSEYSSQSRGGLPRFFSPVLPSAKGGVVRVQGDEFFHITRVLRLSTDDRVELFNGKGGLVSGIIQDVDRAGLEFAALEDPQSIDPPRPQWHVYAAFGTLKGGRADWLVEKCTELGASSVTPLLTERSPSISNNRVERLERVILAATKQCQRLHEMKIHPPLDIRDLADQVRQSKLSFLAVAEAPPLLNVLTSQRNEPEGSIIVGPEGDFTEKESNILMEAGAASVGLGPHRLRVETATIALLATLMLWLRETSKGGTPFVFPTLSPSLNTKVRRRSSVKKGEVGDGESSWKPCRNDQVEGTGCYEEDKEALCEDGQEL